MTLFPVYKLKASSHYLNNLNLTNDCHQSSASPSHHFIPLSGPYLTMPRRKLDALGHDADLFGHRRTQVRRRRRQPSPPAVTREEALRISQQLGFLERQQTPLLNSRTEEENDNDNDNWENVDNINEFENVPDSTGDHYARHQRSLRRAEARARTQHKWKALEAQLTATYLHLQHHTRNWTNEPTYHSYLSNEFQCQCLPEKLRKRCVDLIDLTC